MDFIACPLAWFRLKTLRCHADHWFVCAAAWALLFAFLFGVVTFALCSRMPWLLWLVVHG